MVATLNEMIPSILQLPTFDKIRLIRILAEDIEQPKEVALAALLDPKRIYYVHTPQFAPGTAAQLMQLLQENSPEN
mgnify:CR=1